MRLQVEQAAVTDQALVLVPEVPAVDQRCPRCQDLLRRLYLRHALDPQILCRADLRTCAGRKDGGEPAPNLGAHRIEVRTGNKGFQGRREPIAGSSRRIGGQTPSAPRRQPSSPPPEAAMCRHHHYHCLIRFVRRRDRERQHNAM